jgi:PBP1b-binding outer membrane lipoprotein LpoB
MTRLASITVALALFAAGCSSDSSNPNNPSNPNTPTFTATLSPTNEVPPVSNAESSGSGNATITFNVTRDAAGNVTSGTVTFVVTLQAFPANTPINIAHIHSAPAGSNGGIVINTTLSAAGDAVVLANGSGTFTKGGVTADPAVINAILNNPAGYYFNVHSTLNPGGVARGQLVRVQ